VHTALGPFGKAVAASCPSGYMAQSVALDMAVARLGDSHSANTCYCYCTSAAPGAAWLGYIDHVAYQCYMVFEPQSGIDSCGLGPVQPGRLGRLERLGPPARVVYSEPRLAAVVGCQVQESG
jgi:hypothetical protein